MDLQKALDAIPHVAMADRLGVRRSCYTGSTFVRGAHIIVKSLPILFGRVFLQATATLVPFIDAWRSML